MASRAPALFLLEKTADYRLLTRNTPEKINVPAASLTAESESLPNDRAIAVAIRGCR
jgi:hypothetical protein